MIRRLGAAGETASLLALGAAALHLPLLPYAFGAHGLPMPDLVYCLTIVWTIRRPAETPLWAVVALGVAGDVMLSRPLGLGALGLMLAAEAARSSAASLRAGPFAAEWLTAVGLFAALLLGMQAALRLVFLDGAAWEPLIAHAAATALAYPAIAALAFGYRLRGARSALDRPGRAG